MSASDVVCVRFYGRLNETPSLTALTLAEFESLMYIMAWLLDDMPDSVNQGFLIDRVKPEAVEKMLAAMREVRVNYRDASR